MNLAAIKRWRQRTLSSKRSENIWGNKIVVFLRLADIIFNGHACEAPHISTWWSNKKVQRELRDMSLHFLLPRTSYLKANGGSWKHNKRCSLVKSSTSPRIRIWNHHIKNNIDQQQRNTQQDLFGGAELFHFSYLLFLCCGARMTHNSLVYNFFLLWWPKSIKNSKETYNQVLMRFLRRGVILHTRFFSSQSSPVHFLTSLSVLFNSSRKPSPLNRCL